MKKEYVKPDMKVIEMEFCTNLLASSSSDCENPYWCGEHEGWQGEWGEN